MSQPFDMRTNGHAMADQQHIFPISTITIVNTGINAHPDDDFPAFQFRGQLPAAGSESIGKRIVTDAFPPLGKHLKRRADAMLLEDYGHIQAFKKLKTRIVMNQRKVKFD